MATKTRGRAAKFHQVGQSTSYRGGGKCNGDVGAEPHLCSGAKQRSVDHGDEVYFLISETNFLAILSLTLF